MQSGILIDIGGKKLIFSADRITDGQIFQLVEYIQTIVHQPNWANLITTKLLAFANEEMDIKLTSHKLIAEINISKPSQDF